jgi:carboxyl-terminal processing protease
MRAGGGTRQPAEQEPIMRRSHLWVPAVAIGSILCWQAAQSAPQDDKDVELYRLFVDAVEHIDRSYVKPVDRKKLVFDALQGMVDGLDPYSNFVPNDDRGQFDKLTTGHYGGIGVQVDVLGAGDVRVVSPMVGTPAYDAGILAGDRILKVDGVPLEKGGVADVIGRVSGLPDTPVTLTVQHEPFDKNKPIDVKMMRKIINVESVRGLRRTAGDGWAWLADEAQGLACVRLTAFNQNTGKELAKALAELKAAGKLKGLVLDLRYNPGGLLPVAIEISNLFVKQGKIVSTKGRAATPERSFAADGTAPFADLPIAVLVNHYSASAAEIVAACLQDHQRAVVVGERTWGKGSVQNIFDLDFGKSALKLTVASYHRPSGKNIHRFKDFKDADVWGVMPDAEAAAPFTQEQHVGYSKWRADADLARGKAGGAAKPAPAEFADTQLTKALALLRARMKL